MAKIDPNKFTFDFNREFQKRLEDELFNAFRISNEYLQSSYKASWEPYAGQDNRWQARYHSPVYPGWSDKYHNEELYPDIVESTATKVRSEDVEHNPLKDEYEKLRKEMDREFAEAQKNKPVPPLFEIVDVEWSEVDG